MLAVEIDFQVKNFKLKHLLLLPISNKLERICQSDARACWKSINKNAVNVVITISPVLVFIRIVQVVGFISGPRGDALCVTFINGQNRDVTVTI